MFYKFKLINIYDFNGVILKYSSLLIPGIATLNRGLLAVAYGLALVYLFLGVSIVAEIFMEAIEKITSKQVIVQVK